MQTKILVLLVLYLFVGVELKLTPLTPSESYTHVMNVDEDNPTQYRVYWKVLNESQEIQFEVHCKTSGWVGLGLSPNGGMAGSDIAIGWVNSTTKQAYLKDCYATDKVRPTVDESQDWNLLEGAETNGYTILKYRRKLVTCDEKDKDIIIGTIYMIFAWNDKDPQDGLNNWSYHDTNKFPRTVVLMSYKKETIEEQGTFPADLFTHSLRMRQVKIEPKDTYYYCSLYELPKFDAPTHMIQFEMLVNPSNKAVVHHLLAYECNDDFVPPDSQFSQECGNVELPEKITSNCMVKLIIAWGIGGQYNYSFPKEAGYLFKPATKAKYILLEMHYDNPKLEAQRVDDSGVKLYFTKTLRKYDLGLLTLGLDGNPLSLQMPANANMKFTSFCYPECTETFLPKDGITVVGGLLHTHLTGKSIRTSIARNGTVIKRLMDNPNYDFNYQFLIDITPTKLYKGDALITECVYDTKGRNKFTYFGFSTQDEMCFDFIYYYPLMPTFTTCVSTFAPPVLYDFYQSLMNDKIIPNYPLNLSNMQLFYDSIPSLKTFFNTKVNSTDSRLIKRFEEFHSSPHNKSYVCLGPDRSNILYRPNVAHFTALNGIEESSVCKTNQAGNLYQSIVGTIYTTLVFKLLFNLFN